MCGSTPCAACRGPRRREQRRAHYTATRLAATAPGTTAVLTRPRNADIGGAISTCRAAYASYNANPTHEAEFEAAVRAVGTHVIAVCDPLIAARIAAANCQPHPVDNGALTAARRDLEKRQRQWAAVHAKVRRTHKLATAEAIPHTLLFDAALPGRERRWRDSVYSEYAAAQTHFLKLSQIASGRDDAAMQRQTIRRTTYLEVIGQVRPLGFRNTTTDTIFDAYPTSWLDELTTQVPPTSSTPVPQHHALVHRAEEVIPAVAAAAHAYAHQISCRDSHIVHAATGIGIDGRQEALAVGAEAVFEGRLGGLVGDGYRTRDDHHRAFVLGVWTAL